MKRLDLQSVLKPHFIGNWNIENKELCNKMINFFEASPDLHIKGRTAKGVNENIKKSIDITINPTNLKENRFKIFDEYFSCLHECFTDYKEQFPFLKTFVNKIHIGPFNLQKYLQGDHFGASHSERTDITTIHRLFAWMTYLNDVEDGGTTDFDYYNIKIKPECGKTLIWPAEWTHVHKGSILKSGKKYIITGWFHFADQD
jgi:prolyl 4-hydroxylase|tara:strand:- start:851 stop:1453 length:603 start_codon:yes stop_codon:yes gene_type:complete